MMLSKSEQKICELIRLSASEPSVGQNVLRELIKMGKPAIPYLKVGLRSKDRIIKMRVARVLEKIGEISGVEELSPESAETFLKAIDTSRSKSWSRYATTYKKAKRRKRRTQKHQDLLDMAVKGGHFESNRRKH